ncbi:MAG: hypothetical protein IK012_02195 [Fibrobacter sp.]|uniref:LamG-like jellyroll fold domain-containing protein n=1 Tax=Fibrobacter sp. TaxID=35828 RepID=UPI0025B940C1|nr:LamG-like jellyroll fold domain-containing protein [Fibrobacter sp.]MBR4784047.1 hypothetical protein [Fibrobacter sp.]
MVNNMAQNDSSIFKLSVWEGVDALGISGYFRAAAEKGFYTYDPYVRNGLRCEAPALSMDDHTLFFDELETIYQEGKLVDGVCGKAVSLADGQVAPLGVNLIDSMKVGTVEFWFKPGPQFYDKSARTLLGNDGSRIHFFYKNGELIFQKNHHNQHYFVQAAAELDSGWNLIAGQWGDGYMSLWLNGKLVVKKEHTLGYAPAMRGIPYENLFVIGYKSNCCMEGVGQYQGMTTAGAFDQFRISNIARYEIDDTADVIDDTADVDTVVIQETDEDTVSLWQYFSNFGVSSYFDNAQLPTTSTYTLNVCVAPALAMDDSTVFMDELETVYREGTLVDGVCGKALSLKDGEVAPLGINMIDSMKAGTVEFWFRPGEDFKNKSVRTILGNDESRMHIMYKDGELVFQKNHADKHYFVKGAASFNDDWNLIAAQWGDGYMSIWLNGKKVASAEHNFDYVPSTRSKLLGNLLIIGFKSSCCMEGVGVRSALTASGAYDQLRISNVPRYKVSFDQEFIGETDTLTVDEDDDSCSVGLSLSTFQDSLDANAVGIEMFMEKLCVTDTVPQLITDLGELATFGLTLRNGDVVAENLAAGQVHYGCIDLTNPSVPKMKLTSCVNLAPGEYRFTVAVEGKMAYYKFRIAGEIEE